MGEGAFRTLPLDTERGAWASHAPVKPLRPPDTKARRMPGVSLHHLEPGLPG